MDFKCGEYTTHTQRDKFNLLIDLQNSIKSQTSPGYERWTKNFNLKQAAATLAFLQENGLDDYAKLTEQAAQATTDFNSFSAVIKTVESRMTEITKLQKHIINYSKTREIYAAYRKSGYSKNFLQNMKQKSFYTRRRNKLLTA